MRRIHGVLWCLPRERHNGRYCKSHVTRLSSKAPSSPAYELGLFGWKQPALYCAFELTRLL